MRFAIYLTILFSILPIILMRPFFGLCAYYIVSLLQPKLLCWQPSFPDAMLVGVPLVIGAIAIGVKRRIWEPQLDRQGRIIDLRERIIRSPILEPHWLLGACAALLLYITMTRLIVPYPMDVTTDQFRSLWKVNFVVMLLTGLASDLRRFRVLYILVALSVAFWAIKGGLKVIVLGPHQVYGKTYDNNYFALTSVMVLPMVFYFAMSVKHTRWRSVLLVASALICLAVIGSRSRAGFVAFAVVLTCMAWSSRYRLKAMVAVLLFTGVALALSGSEVRDRINSIVAYQSDRSASSRFFTWEVAIDLLKQNPVLGVGFGNFEIAKDAFVGGRKAAHNIFLQNLAELGLVGHPIWLAIVLGSLGSSWVLMRWARRLPTDMRWAYHWSRGLMLGLLAFCIHGFFHNEEYLELMFVMVGLVVALQVVVRRELYRRKMEESRGMGAATEVELATAAAAAQSSSEPPKRRRVWHPGELVRG